MIRDYQAIGQTWFLKGKQKKIPTYGLHRGVRLFGTLDYESGEIFCTEEETSDAQVFLSFLEKVLQKYKGKRIAMVLDNAKIHHAKLLKPFLEANRDRLEFHFLPPYSPDLNLIEKFWAWLKKSCVYNVFYSSINEIRVRIKSFIEKVNQDPFYTIDRLCLSLY